MYMRKHDILLTQLPSLKFRLSLESTVHRVTLVCHMSDGLEVEVVGKLKKINKYRNVLQCYG